MKKIIATLLVSAMLLACVVLFASCSSMEKPELNDLEDVAEVLEDEDYVVSYSDDEDDLGVGIEERLYASKGEAEDYEYLSIIVYADSTLAETSYQQLKAEYDYQIQRYEQTIKYYEHVLEEYNSDLDSDTEDRFEEYLADAQESLENYKENYTYGKDGNTVWYGTVTAAEDSKG